MGGKDRVRGSPSRKQHEEGNWIEFSRFSDEEMLVGKKDCVGCGGDKGTGRRWG